MEFFEETELIENLPEPKKLLDAFRGLTEKRHLLLKQGRIFKMRTYRHFTFNNDYILYFGSEFSTSAKGKIHLHKAIAIPFQSPVPQYSSCLKIISYCSSDFYILCNDQQELETMIHYIKLASNNMLQSVLDEIYFSAIDYEFEILKTPKNLKSLKIETYLTPKNAISRFLFSPTSDGNFQPPDEEIVLELPLNSPGHIKLEIDKAQSYLEVQESTEKINFFASSKLPEFLELKNGSIEEIRELGIKYLWNYQLDYAKQTFEGIRNKDLRSALHCAEICLLRVLITGRKSDIKNSMEELESFQKIYATSTEQNSELLNAELMLFKSIILIITGQKFKAFISLRNCWKTYKKFEKKSGLDLDMVSRLELGLGIFLLLVSLSPSSVTTILHLAGFSSSRDQGLSHLNKCFEMNSSRSPYAAILLSLYYVDLEPDINKAYRFIEVMKENYPGCVLLHWINSIISWKNNQIETAIEYLNLALKYCGEELSSQAAFIKYELGWFYFLRFEWVSAKKQFEGILLDTLSLSSELDGVVKYLLQHEKLEPSQITELEAMYNRKKLNKKKSNWLESDKTPDRVYLPHKSCLITQLVSCLSALNSQNEIWLKIIQISANCQGSHSNLDEDFGGLSQSYLYRKSTILMPYEVIYFMKQHTKLLPHMLLKIYITTTDLIFSLDQKKSQNYAEYCSARMLQIMALALNGETGQAVEICDSVVDLVDKLPVWANYIAPHTLYWCSRVYIAEGNKKIAGILLKKAKKYKKYIFDIKNKIDRVISEML
jgi:Protein of unknown function (DUF3808)